MKDYGKYSKVCPECEGQMSPYATRCIGCHRLATNPAYIKNDDKFKQRLHEKVREIAIERGVSLEFLGLSDYGSKHYVEIHQNEWMDVKQISRLPSSKGLALSASCR